MQKQCIYIIIFIHRFCISGNKIMVKLTKSFLQCCYILNCTCELLVGLARLSNIYMQIQGDSSMNCWVHGQSNYSNLAMAACWLCKMCKPSVCSMWNTYNYSQNTCASAFIGPCYVSKIGGSSCERFLDCCSPENSQIPLD